jgi:regulator of sigma E protease
MISTDSVTQFLVSAAAFVVAIGILVAVHEFGHFWVARRLGMRVLRFSIGFGKPLWRRELSKKDPFEFVIAAIPLGGYVKLLDEREAPVPAHEVGRAFNRQPVWKRIAVLLAGPVFNLVFAIAAYWALFTVGVPAFKPIVGEVAPNSIAARAGLKYEDQIVAVAGRDVETMETATLSIVKDLVDDGSIAMRVRDAHGAERELVLHAGESRALTEPEALLPGLGFDFWRPRVAAVVASVVEGSAAERAELKPGDRILKFDGKPIGDFAQLVQLVQPSMNKTVDLQIEREGRTMTLPITVGEQTSDGKRMGFIGIAPTNEPLPGGRDPKDMLAVQKYGPVAALGQAAGKTWDTSILTFQVVGRILTGDVSVKAISGPITIAEITGVAARQDWSVFLNVLALISISLGVFNLLPIPLLDGGQIVYQLAELIKGKPLSERVQMLGQQIGIAVLLMLMSVVFYYDIARQLN